MDTNSNATINNENLEIEHDNAEDAFIEFEETGHTNRRCLRCGGQFHFYEAGNSYQIWCENNDFKITVRGL
jgi:xanthine dehydrogenase molybdopterin-binding subunit B